jgi:dienelactone hydrolase
MRPEDPPPPATGRFIRNEKPSAATDSPLDFAAKQSTGRSSKNRSRGPVSPSVYSPARQGSCGAADHQADRSVRPATAVAAVVAAPHIAVTTPLFIVMGHSCGGLRALAVEGDPRIKATMIWHSGADDRPAGRIGARVSEQDLAKVARPIAYIHGGMTDIA